LFSAAESLSDVNKCAALARATNANAIRRRWLISLSHRAQVELLAVRFKAYDGTVARAYT
jgi:hypothetical protein